MKTVLACLLVLSAAAAPAQTLQDCTNSLGIFTVPEPDLADLFATASYNGGPGLVATYVVLINPYNENTGEAIATLGGYEFRVGFPTGLVVVPHLPPGVGNYMNFPDLSCGVELPVAGRQCVLLSMDIGAFDLDPVEFYLTPVSQTGQQSVPGEMVIADAGDGLSISRMAPVSLDYDVPVFTMFHFEAPPPASTFWVDCEPVPNQATSWSGIKAMYR